MRTLNQGGWDGIPPSLYKIYPGFSGMLSLKLTAIPSSLCLFMVIVVHMTNYILITQLLLYWDHSMFNRHLHSVSNSTPSVQWAQLVVGHRHFQGVQYSILYLQHSIHEYQFIECNTQCCYWCHLIVEFIAEGCVYLLAHYFVKKSFSPAQEMQYGSYYCFGWEFSVKGQSTSRSICPPHKLRYTKFYKLGYSTDCGSVIWSISRLRFHCFPIFLSHQNLIYLPP